MMYPFMTLNDNTEIVHSEIRKDGTVKVYVEKPDAKYGFRHMTCILPSYSIEESYELSPEEIDQYLDLIRSVAHIIMELAQEGDRIYAASV